MQDEQVDVVTENNQVVGSVSKTAAHQQGLLHRCVVSQLIDSQGRWTLVQQAADRQDAGQFVSPVGGHVSAGEDEVAALRREAQEEMGIEVKNFRKVGELIFNREVIGRKENHLFLVYEIFCDDEIRINHEAVATHTFAVDELRAQLQTHPERFGDAFHVLVRTLYPELLWE